jgi:predicted CoA-binding protein
MGQGKEIIKCEFGVMKKIWLSERKVVLIHSPQWTETARRIQEELMTEGYDVIRLNTGVEEDARRAEELLDICFSSFQ